MNQEPLKCVLISDFNIQNFARYLANDRAFPPVKPVLAPFGQVNQTLMDSDSDLWRQDPDLAVIWTLPENIIPSFKDFLEFKSVPLQKMLDSVDEFCRRIALIAPKLKSLFLISWIIDPRLHLNSILNLKEDQGVSNILMRLNLRVSQNLKNIPNLYILDSQRWLSLLGAASFNSKLWYMAKVPFANEFFMEAVKEIKSALNTISGNSKKLIILDLDNTLWGGIVGDAGWQNLVLGGHSPSGEAFVDFQRALKSFKNRGIMLAIVSKNEESVALKAIEKHPEMILKIDDFVAYKINWKDKSQNIIDLVSGLNLGLQSAVFIDDNPVEQDRVRNDIPHVLVPQWPTDPRLYKGALMQLDCFDSVGITAEDLHRSQLYQNEAKRETAKEQAGSYLEWLKSLQMRITVEELNISNLPRATQLLNKSNQMNLSTRRLDENQLIKWAKEPQNKLWVFRVQDKFGDAGLTGILSLAVNGRAARIIDFVLSCRVMGRKVEEIMLSHAIDFCRRQNITELAAQYLKTEKNKPCYDFYKSSGFAVGNGELFSWDCKNEYPLPAGIKIAVQN